MAKQISSLSVVLGATVKPFVSAFASVRNVVSNFTSSISSAGFSILKFTGLAGLASTAFAALKSAASGISLAAELEQTEVAFQTMLGSASAAQAMMTNLKDFAASTPFEFPEIASSAKSLIAFGIAANDIPKTLQMVGDVASGVGVNVKELATIYGKAKTAGRLYAQDINELTGRGIPIIKELAKQFGVSESEVKNLVESGRVGFPQLQKAFESMTGPGGQFADMMAMQSQTLAGLWSTLSDTIGMTMADLTTTIVKAFGLKDAMKSLTTFLAGVGTSLNAAISRYAPVIVGFLSSAYASVVSYASAIYAHVAPIVQRIAQTVWTNWNQILASTVRYLSAVYDFFTAVLNAALNIAGIVWGGIASVWAWGCNLVGYQTQETGSSVGNTFQGIIDVALWLQGTVSQVLTVLAFAINNFAGIVQYAGTSAAYYIVEFYNQAEWALRAAWQYFKWFATNLPNILLDASINSSTVMQNLLTNIVSVVGNLPGLISGSTSLADVWSPLTDGLRNTTSELPTIAARIPGDLEAALGAQSSDLGDGLVNGLLDSLNDADKQAARATQGIGDVVSDVAAKFDVKPPVVEAPKPNLTGVEAATEAMDTLGKTTDRATKSWAALVAGSAEAQQAHAIAAMEASLSSRKPGAAATASPVPKAAISAIAKGTTDRAGGKDDMTTYVKGIFEWLKANGVGPELTEAA